MPSLFRQQPPWRLCSSVPKLGPLGGKTGLTGGLIEEPSDGKDKSSYRDGCAEHNRTKQYSVGEFGLRLIGGGIAEIARVVSEALDGSRHKAFLRLGLHKHQRSSADAVQPFRSAWLTVH